MSGGSSEPVIVRANGEIDLDAPPALRRAPAAVLESRRGVVLDLSEVMFMDCAGLGIPVRARSRAGRCGARPVLRGAGCRVVRLLELAGLRRRLPVGPSPGVAGARAGQDGGRERDDASMGGVPGEGPGAR